MYNNVQSSSHLHQHPHSFWHLYVYMNKTFMLTFVGIHQQVWCTMYGIWWCMLDSIGATRALWKLAHVRNSQKSALQSFYTVNSVTSRLSKMCIWLRLGPSFLRRQTPGKNRNIFLHYIYTGDEDVEIPTWVIFMRERDFFFEGSSLHPLAAKCAIIHCRSQLEITHVGIFVLHVYIMRQ